MVLYNVCQCPTHLKVCSLKLLALYRFYIMVEKLKYDTSNQKVQDQENFITKTLTQWKNLEPSPISDYVLKKE